MNAPKNVSDAARTVREDGLRYFHQRIDKRIQKALEIAEKDAARELLREDDDEPEITWSEDEEDTAVRHVGLPPPRQSSHP